MIITVIVCTYNRCQSLPTALESIAASKLPESVEWEVLVVDNNSKDQTREVVADFFRRFPGRFRYLFEAQPGKSYALNSGIREAQGQILAFVDDDVTVEPFWLDRLTSALSSGGVAGCGGRVMPQWACSPPEWMPQDGRYPMGPLVMFDLGRETAPLKEPPFGTNMAYRRDLFGKYGGFRTDLGPTPGSEIRGEDSEFGHRLFAAGEVLLYEPAAVVHHPVAKSRLQKKYFLTWWFDKARADVRAGILPDRSKFSIKGIPLYLFRRLIVRAVLWIVAFGQSRRFSNKIKVWYLAGQILECHRHGSPGKRHLNHPAQHANVS
jgi:glycosyltransferase involved in cell wall biosynthesis